MRPTNDPEDSGRRRAREDLLLRTRKGVLNVMVGAGLLIAVSGWVLRRRAQAGIGPPPRGLHDELLFALIIVAVVSYLVRRAWIWRPESLEHATGRARFYRLHVGAAAIAVLGVPLGIAYGWFVDPRLEGVAPFWVVPMAMGILAIPRRGEIADSRFDIKKSNH